MRLKGLVKMFWSEGTLETTERQAKDNNSEREGLSLR